MGVMAGGDQRGRALDQVLVDPERLIELSEGLLEAMRDASTLDVVEALVIRSCQPIDDAEGTGLGEEGVVIDEAPQRKERVHAPGFPMVLENAIDSHHHARPVDMSTRSCFAAS